MHPRITFGIIVLNGSPFTTYNLKALYPYAHEIIIVEGAAPSATNIATKDGHSLDNTCEEIRDFQKKYDPENKIQFVTAEDEGHPDGFWPGEKDEQSQAYAKRATGDYLWQVDVDEFYLPAAMEKIIAKLALSPEITAVSFIQKAFWGDVDIQVDSLYLQNGGEVFHRLFKWGEGYKYINHRPPTVLNEKGVDTRNIVHMSANETAELNVYLLHYSLLFPKQVKEKCAYYANVDWTKRQEASIWAENNYMYLSSPWRVYNVYSHISWLNSYTGQVPKMVCIMMKDIRTSKSSIELRQNDDARALLKNPVYIFKRYFISRIYFYRKTYNQIAHITPTPIKTVIKHVMRLTK